VVPEVTYCVVNTNQRELLLRGLDAVGRERAAVPFATECLVLDNASTDGSAEAARGHPAVTEVMALQRRQGKGENDSALLQRTKGQYGLLLNEDSELLPGATLALHDALERRPDAAAAGARLLHPDGTQPPSAWRFPTPGTALNAALLRHARNVQSTGTTTKEVDWAQSSALLVRRDAAAQIGWFDPRFFVYSDEVDFARRLRDAGWAILWVPEAEAVHHEQLRTGGVPERRIVEFARNRDLYMRTHHGDGAAAQVRWLTAPPYALRAAAALLLPGHDPRRYWRHVTATLRPHRGEVLREAAEEFNAERQRPRENS
jgi:N-acetylglucosaminyl-diphospho-decaprenol L-rhamnosyltransferase